jgi:hypothetical protein
MLRSVPLALAVVLGVAACTTSSPPFPARGPEPESAAFVAVPDAPPPARPEVIRANPDPAAVWVDGQWERVDDKWRWARGGWVVPPPGARFTAFRVRRDAEGDLEFAPARWTDANGKVIDVPRTRKEAP